jgi:hypothetical protein
MLNNHKNIIVPPECGFAVWFYHKFVNAPITGSVIRDFVVNLATAKKIETWRLDFDALEKYLKAIEPDTYPELVSCVYEFYGNSVGKKSVRWGDKNNFYSNHVDIIRAMFPSCCLIHIVRDGRDVACSYRTINRSHIRSKYAPQLPNEIAEIATEWITNLGHILGSFEKAGWSNVYELRYEDLTLNPVAELQKLCTFLGEPYDNEMESYYLKNQLEQQEPIEFLQWKAKTLERPTTSEIGKYQSELSQDEISGFERIAQRMLRRYGYIP